MAEVIQNVAKPVAFASTSKTEAWVGPRPAGSFEAWRFDAMSDDGREAAVITFYDNYPFSARYVRSRHFNGQSPARTPAISFVYSVDGKAVIRAVNEFSESEAQVLEHGQQFGSSLFRTDTISYGNGYVLSLELLTSRKRRIVAELEWLSVDSDLAEGALDTNQPLINWVAPRSDVSGRISVIGRRGKLRRVVHFRGTGSHDHVRCPTAFDLSLRSEYTGCAHYADSTAIFYHRELSTDDGVVAKLFMVVDGAMKEFALQPESRALSRKLFGIKVPRRMSYGSECGSVLEVVPTKLIKSGFCEIDMLSRITLVDANGVVRNTVGITQFVEPRHVRRRLVQWLSNLRIGRNGKAPIF